MVALHFYILYMCGVCVYESFRERECVCVHEGQRDALVNHSPCWDSLSHLNSELNILAILELVSLLLGSSVSSCQVLVLQMYHDTSSAWVLLHNKSNFIDWVISQSLMLIF